jgi:hypothetical protein
MAFIYAVSLKFLLMSLAYAAISSIAAYGLQRVTFAVVSYILLAFYIVGSLISAASNVLELNIAEHTVSGITDRILAGMTSGAFLPLPIIEYIAYVLIAAVFAVMAFCQKEMEF